MRFVPSLFPLVVLLAIVDPAVAQPLPMVLAETKLDQEAEQLLQQGNEQLYSGNYQAALPLLEQALALYQQLDDRAGEGQALKSLGNVYYLLEDYPRSLDYQQQALAIAQARSDLDLEARVLNNLGNVYRETGDTDRALALFQQSLAIAQQIEIPAVVQIALRNLGMTYEQLQDYDAAIATYQQLLTLAQQQEDPEAEAWWRNHLVSLYSDVGKTTDAIALLETQLEQHRSQNNRLQEASTLNQLSLQQGEAGALPEAMASARQSAKIAQELQNPLLEATALSSLASTYERSGDLQQAITHYQNSLQRVRLAKQTEAYAELAVGSERTTLSSLAILSTQLGEFSQAIDYREQLLALAKQLGDRVLVGESLRELGAIYQGRDDFGQAIDYFEQGLQIARETGNPIAEIQALDSIAANYFAVGNFEQMQTYGQQMLQATRRYLSAATSETTVSPKFAKLLRQYVQGKEVLALVTLGNAALFGSNDRRQAMAYFEQALTQAKSLDTQDFEVLALSSAGAAAAWAGDFQGAVEQFKASVQLHQSQTAQPRSQQQSLTVFDRGIEGQALSQLARAYAMAGNAEKALETAQQGWEISQAVDSTAVQAGAWETLGYAYLLAGDLPEAERHMRRAIAGFDAVRAKLGARDRDKVSLFDIQDQTYRLLSRALVQQQKPQEALEISEWGRARAFIELLQKRFNLQSTPTPEPERLTVEAIQQIARNQQATLVQYQLQFDPRDEAEKQPTALYIWAISPQGEIAFRQQSLADTHLNDLVANTRQTLGARSNRAGIVPQLKPEYVAQHRAETDRKLTQLHNQLIDPIADLLPANPAQTVIFIPQGSLFSVPFPALMDDSGQALIERHAIAIAPSIQTLALTQQQAQRQALKRGTALIVGNPTMPAMRLEPGKPPQPLRPLPGAAAEAEAIAKRFNVSALLGSRATEATIKQQLPHAQLIHLATHGILDDRRALSSALALAPTPGEDGLLTAEEILDMQLQADLAVLSACDTGRGQITGDGVIGLSRALFSAGVPSAIVSLWAVPDAPTAELMLAFYEYRDQGLDKAQALRQAMLDTKVKHPNPLDWAAFTLIGEAR